MRRLAAVALVAALSACGVKAPPRPPVEAGRAAGAPAAAEPGSGGGAAPADDCSAPRTTEPGGTR